MIVNNTNFLNHMFVLPPDTKPTKDTVSAAIAFNEGRTSIYRNLYYYYRGYQDIFTRDKRDGLKNNRLMINHAEYIVDINTGYLLGDAVEYQTNNDEKEIPYDIDAVLDEYKKQTIWMTDHALALHNGIYGKNYEYIFVRKGLNELKSVSIAPTNCIIAYDDTLEHNKLFAVIYSLAGTFPSSAEGLQTYNGYQNATVITDKEIIEFVANGQLVEGNAGTPHSFGKIPVIEYRNNYFARGDFFSVVSLMDAYNILQSDRVNDKEQLVEAALLLKGFTMTKEQIADFKRTRTVHLPKDADMAYLTKELRETEIDVLRKSIENDIHKISKTPNLSDENFVGNSSGVAIEFKLIAFQQSIKNKEVYMTKSLMERFEIYNTYLYNAKKMDDLIPVEEVTAIFKKALPQDDLQTAQMIATLQGIVSKQTLISQLSFIEDSKEEIEALEAEQLEEGNSEDPNFGTTNRTDANMQDNTNNAQINATSMSKTQTGKDNTQPMM